MTNEAVLEASYSDFKLIKTRSVISLSFEVPVEQANLVHHVLGIPQPGNEMSVAIARLSCTEKSYNSEVAEKPKKGEHGDYANKLYKRGFFLIQEVLEALGSDEEFKAWIRLQPSCVSGKQDYIGMDNGEMKCEASHVERVHAGHGKGIKAKFSCVPLTHEEHAHRHRAGELSLLVNGAPELSPPLRVITPEGAKDWFWDQRCKKVTEWAKERFKAIVSETFMASYTSLAEIPPKQIEAWAESHNLTNFLPQPRE